VIRLIKDEELDLLKDDPVRPHLSWKWRRRSGREVYVLEREEKVAAVICVAFMDEVPASELDMERQGMSHAIFYTVWSYDKGAGREIVLGIANRLKMQRPWVKRFVTLSPLTEIAERFHLKNGAKFLAKYKDCQNFEYEL
tara:strand:+ start:15095 stop:15514 length:420 start_codon:yes stop_codon:yes gene_type:complete